MNGNTVNPIPFPSRGYEAAWAMAAQQLSSAYLPGLRLPCPVCGGTGTLVSKWKPKTPVKPLFVVHPNGSDELTACQLDEQQAKVVRTQVRLGAKDVTRTLRMGRPFVMFSGGRDSLATLEYVRRLAERAGVEVTALHADTTAGFPEVEDYVREVCDRMGVPLVNVRPTHDYFDIAKRWGIPGVRSRWCCETLKIAPMRRYLATVEPPKVIYDGIRAAESSLRAKYTPVWFHPAFRSICVSPLFGWSDDQVRAYIERNGLPQSPAAKLGTSAECWCGAYKCKADFEALLKVHPDIFDKLVEVEKAQDGEFTFLYEKGRRVPLETLKTGGSG
jgi:3'-phosphoadenosine 5'-phosphosulfate sulfotransferase (PAPS reductase)/FAD synthetase